MLVSIEKPGTPYELLHFGVKGMRWGVRRAGPSDEGGSTKSRKGPPPVTKTKAWKSWSKLANKNVNAYNNNKHYRTASKAAAILLVGVGVAGTAYILKSQGNLPMSSVFKGNKRPLDITGPGFKAFTRSPREQAKWESHMAKTLGEISSRQASNLQRIETQRRANLDRVNQIQRGINARR